MIAHCWMENGCDGETGYIAAWQALYIYSKSPTHEDSVAYFFMRSEATIFFITRLLGLTAAFSTDCQ